MGGRAELVLTKQQGEPSFGMFLAIDPRVHNAEFATVSFITPLSPAHRAGLRPGTAASDSDAPCGWRFNTSLAGWVLLQINGQSARCSHIREVANMFKGQATASGGRCCRRRTRKPTD